ncbi:MAG: TetR family transcriptional regulator [Bauldia sp.]|nr:TetR family transcriptional regulator [Bauldia sp.]
MRADEPALGGLRERKRRQTLQRITDAAVRLFLAQGYEATTLDAIAAEAGISRRSFFSYFRSKDDILLSLQGSFGDEVAAEVRKAPPGSTPLHAVRDALIAACAPYPADEMIVIDRLMRSSEAVQARKQASYVQQERTLFEALRERWPDPERETALRLVAMMSIGAVRLSLDALSREGGRRSLVELLGEAFEALERAI